MIKRVWIGGHRKWSDMNKWVWSDGSTWYYTNWIKEIPNHVTGKCLVMHRTGLWDGNDCSKLRSFVCQQDPLQNSKK